MWNIDQKHIMKSCQVKDYVTLNTDCAAISAKYTSYHRADSGIRLPELSAGWKAARNYGIRQSRSLGHPFVEIAYSILGTGGKLGFARFLFNMETRQGILFATFPLPTPWEIYFVCPAFHSNLIKIGTCVVERG